MCKDEEQLPSPSGSGAIESALYKSTDFGKSTSLSARSSTMYMSAGGCLTDDTGFEIRIKIFNIQFYFNFFNEGLKLQLLIES